MRFWVRKRDLARVRGAFLGRLRFLIAAGALLAAPAVASAQPSSKVARIGYLAATVPATVAARTEAFRRGLRELGYVEGKNIIIEYRYADGNIDRVVQLANELVNLKVDVIVTGGGMDTRAAQKATKTIPIVMLQDPDPVSSGFVASLARPGGNITGLSTLSAATSEKQVEFLKEIVPGIAIVAVFGTSTNPINAEQLKAVERAAARYRLKVRYLEITGSKDVEAAFRAAKKENAGGVLVLSSPILTSESNKIAGLARGLRLPTIVHAAAAVEEGALMSYGVDFPDLARRAAAYVSRILGGGSPPIYPLSSRRSSSW